MPENQEQDATVHLLKEILKWTKFQGMQNVKQSMESELDGDRKRLVFELSDGKSSPKIAKIVRVTSVTVRNYWKKWARMGIAEIHPDYNKRHRRVFSLEEAAMEVPEQKRSNQLKTIKL